MGTPHASQGPLLDVDQLAERLNISVRHVRRLVAERRVPYLKVGHLVRFDPAAIETWLQGLIACTGTRESGGSTVTFASRGGLTSRRSSGAA